MLFGFTSQIGVHGFVPKLFNTFPVFDLTTFEDVRDLMGFLMSHGFIANIEIKISALEFGIFLNN